MGKFTVPTEDQEALLKSEGIDPEDMLVWLAGEDKLIIRNARTGTDIALYFVQRIQS